MDRWTRRGYLLTPCAAFFVALALLAFTPAAAQVVVNEIMQNPSAVSDSSGEWLEIFNPGGAAVDINGWTILDNDSDSHVITHGGPLLVPAGGFLVLGNNSDMATNGGVDVAYSYGSSWFLSNSGDEVVLLDPFLNEIDRVEYDGGPLFPDPTGASMALLDPALDNNLGANWCESTTAFGDGDLGSPGTVNDCTAPAPPLVINEIMQNPSAVSDDSGEWLEIHNPTAGDVDIDGWTIADNDSDSHVIANGGPLLVSAGGYLVLGNNADFATNGGVDVAYSYGASWFLSNSADEVVLFDATLAEVDRVEYDGGPLFPDPSGASMALLDPELDNNLGANWCESTTAFGDGDLGTPGAINDCAEAPPALVINEIMQNPDAVSDADGEWLEIHNPTAGEVDIDGWTIADNDSDSHLIANGGPLLVPAGGYIVLGNNADFITNGGVNVAYSYGASWFLSNSADEVVLFDAALSEVDRVEYDGGVIWPDPTGASMALESPGLDNNDGANWCEAKTPFGDGDLGTPGSFNDCIDAPSLVINEIDYDQAGTDGAEFIEIKNVGTASANLDTVVIDLVNGNDDSIYQTIDLPAVELAVGDYYVVCGNAANVFNCDLDVTPDTNLVQNGAPDAVALRFGALQLDSVSYEGDVGGGYTEGSGVGLEDDSGIDFAGISRFPDGLDTDVNNSDLSPRCISPGESNLADSANCSDPRGGLIVNEIDYDQSGTDGSEFIEIHNIGNDAVDLDPYTIDLVNGDGTVVYDTIDLPAVALGAGDYYVVCGDAANVANCDLDVSPDTNLIQNGAPDAVALVLDGAIVDTVSYEGDTAGYTEGSGVGLEDLSTVAGAGISRFPNAGDTGVNNVDFSLRCVTPGGPNTSVSDACDFSGIAEEIWAIQGAGLSSPFVGQVVTTLDNIVTAVGPDGFTVQTPEVRSDGNEETSDGIFVFTGVAPTVAVGDQVDIRGEVVEFFDLTEFGSSPLVAVGSAGNPLPVAVFFDENTPSPIQPQPDNELERFEGMLVSFVGLATGPTDQFGDVPVVAQPTRSFREKGIEWPGLPGLPVWDGNPEIFEVNPDRMGLSDAAVFATQTIAATGPLGFSFGDYQIWPTSLTLGAEPEFPRAVRPREPGEFTVGSLNLFRLFDDIDDSGEEIVDSAEYQRRLDKFSTYIREVLDSPDILAVQEVEKLGVLDDLAARILLDAPTVAYTAYLEEGNDIGGIDVGFLVRATVQVNRTRQLGADEILTFDGSLLHDRPPLILKGDYVANGVPFPFAVMVVHNRSLSGIDDPADGERVRQKRFEQAESIASKANHFTHRRARLVVLGDFNAFHITDSYVDVVGEIRGRFDPDENLLSGDDLVSPNLSLGTLVPPAGEAYSFIFGGSAQALDHVLVDQLLRPFARDVQYGHGNADAPASLLDDGTTALRSSDHDGVVLYVMSDADGDGIPDDEE